MCIDIQSVKVNNLSGIRERIEIHFWGGIKVGIINGFQDGNRKGESHSYFQKN